jgi:hypothetical protein
MSQKIYLNPVVRHEATICLGVTMSPAAKSVT